MLRSVRFKALLVGLLAVTVGASSTSVAAPGRLQATGAAATNAPNVIVGVGTNGVTGSTPHVQIDNYYAAGVDLGAYAATAYIVRVDGDGNLTAGSTGALHGWLVQTPIASSASGTKFWRGQGNFVLTDGSSTPTFTNSIFPGIVGSYYHFARQISHDGGNALIVRDYVNGACFMRYVAATLASGKNTRDSSPVGTGGTMLGLFGTDHQGGNARVAQWAVYEGANFFSGNAPQNSSPPAFLPLRTLPSNFGGAEATLLLSFDRSAAVFPDMSSGYTKGTGTRYYQFPGSLGNSVPGQPAPALVYDAKNPVGKTGDLTFAAVSAKYPSFTPADRGVPSGVNLIAFDYWRRPATGPQDWFLQPLAGPNMGSTDSRGVGGAKAWRQRMMGGGAFPTVRNSRAMGIFYGYDATNGGREIGILKSYEGQPVIADVDCGTANQFVYSERSNTIDGSTAVVARINDASSFMAIHALNSSTIVLMDVQGGGNVIGFTWLATPTNLAWRKVAIGCNATSCSGYVDSPSGSPLTGRPGLWETLSFPGTVYTDSVHNTATNCGLGNLGGQGVAGDPMWDSVEWGAYSH